MADVSSELMYGTLKNLQAGTGNLELVAIDHARSLSAVRGHAASIQTDTNNIYGVLTRIDQRLDRIERRLELREFAEAQKPCEPK